MALIFCIKCMFLKDKERECENPENLELRRDWYNEYFKSKEKPSKINKNNDCVWFKEK